MSDTIRILEKYAICSCQTTFTEATPEVLVRVLYVSHGHGDVRGAKEVLAHVVIVRFRRWCSCVYVVAGRETRKVVKSIL